MTPQDSYDRAARSDGAKAPIDVITDFTAGEDRIDLSDMDANPAGGGSNDAFAFPGNGAFTGRAGQVRATFADGIVNIFLRISTAIASRSSHCRADADGPASIGFHPLGRAAGDRA